MNIENIRLTPEFIETKYNCTKTRNSTHYALVESIANTATDKAIKKIVELLETNETPWAFPQDGHTKGTMLHPAQWEALKKLTEDRNEL